jgi:dienelactone hydrolase
VAVLAALVLVPAPADAGLSRVSLAYADAGREVRLDAWLYEPEGEGPFPALVLLHGCSGIERNHHAWARRFADWGYVALVVDALGPRGIDTLCTWTGFLRLSYGARVADAYAAAAFLRARPEVDAGRVSVVGWSHGGIIALKLATSVATRPRALDVAVEPFRAVVAFYPYCGGADGEVDRPTLILIGTADDWTPEPACRGFARAQNLGRGFVDLVSYEGATHSFDEAAVGSGIDYLGHRLRYDAAATEDAAGRIADFLARAMPD